MQKAACSEGRPCGRHGCCKPARELALLRALERILQDLVDDVIGSGRHGLRMGRDDILPGRADAWEMGEQGLLPDEADGQQIGDGGVRCRP